MQDSPIPIIDISLLKMSKYREQIASQISMACKEHGFFYISGHGVSHELQEKLKHQSEEFFLLPVEDKLKISMAKGGKAWRGFFPLGAELTSGKPDIKEGIYFGTELGPKDSKVLANIPMHGKNLFPDKPKGYRKTVLEYMDAVVSVGHIVMEGISLSLGLPANYFYTKYNQDPLILFRVFHYPPQDSTKNDWGVGEHTDYGLLTILMQDDVGGLQVKSRGVWVDAPPIENTFICNIGDMLDKMTGGVYQSTPHRVRNLSGKERFSFPLFFDPGFDTIIEKIEHIPLVGHEKIPQRWDRTNVHEFGGTYGQYLLSKVGKVFPELKDKTF